MSFAHTRKCNGHRHGKPCKQPARKGKTKCRLCGGNSLEGLASPRYKTGRYSKYLPLSLSSGYEEALADPNLHSIADEIALTQTRLDQLVQRLASSDLGNQWVAVSEALDAFDAARTAQDVPAMGEAMRALEAGIRKGKSQHLLWADIIDKVKVVSDLRLKEHQRLLQLGAVMNVDRANILFGILLKAVRSAILTHADPATARAILTDIQAAIGGLDTRSVARPGLPLPGPGPDAGPGDSGPA